MEKQEKRQKKLKVSRDSLGLMGFSQALTSPCGKITPCLLLSTSDLRGAGSVCAHRANITSKHTKEALCAISHAQPLRQRVHMCTAADRYSRFHEAGSHEGSLTKDCGSAGRKWSTPLDMNRKQPGKRTLTGHTHTQRVMAPA